MLKNRTGKIIKKIPNKWKITKLGQEYLSNLH